MVAAHAAMRAAVGAGATEVVPTGVMVATSSALMPMAWATTVATAMATLAAAAVARAAASTQPRSAGASHSLTKTWSMAPLASSSCAARTPSAGRGDALSTTWSSVNDLLIERRLIGREPSRILETCFRIAQRVLVGKRLPWGEDFKRMRAVRRRQVLRVGPKVQRSRGQVFVVGMVWRRCVNAHEMRITLVIAMRTATLPATLPCTRCHAARLLARRDRA